MLKITKTSQIFPLIIFFILTACNGSETESDYKNFEIRNIHLYTTAPETFDSCMVNHDNYWDQLANCDHQIVWPDGHEAGSAYKAFTVESNSVIVVQLYAVNKQRDTKGLGVSINSGPESSFELDFSEWGQLETFEIGIDILSDGWIPGTYALNYWLISNNGRRTPVYTLEIVVSGSGGLSASAEPGIDESTHESKLLDFEVLSN